MWLHSFHNIIYFTNFICTNLYFILFFIVNRTLSVIHFCQHYNLQRLEYSNILENAHPISI